MEAEGHFNKWQRAYLKNKEAGEHTYRLGRTARTTIKKGWCTGAVLLDVEKAFDAVWHNGLKFKLLTADYNIPMKLTRLMSSFLDSRTIKVKSGDTYSEVVELNAGTPQGSVLSPILFLIYVNDIPIATDDKQNTGGQFADDVTLWASDKSQKRVNIRLQKALAKLEKWCATWRVKLNAAKTQYIMFSKSGRKPTGNLTLFGEIIQKYTQVTLLGVIFDSRMTLRPYCDKIVTRINQRLSLLRKIKNIKWGASTDVILKVYKQFIRPLIEYASVLLADSKKTNLNRLQLAQNKALRVALTKPRNTKITTLHKLARVEPIADRLKYLGTRTIQRFQGSKLFMELEEEIDFLEKCR